MSSSDATSDARAQMTWEIILAVCVVILILILCLATYFWACRKLILLGSRPALQRGYPAELYLHVSEVGDGAIGLDEAVLDSIPQFVYAEAKLTRDSEAGGGSSCCSICLAEYKETDIVRVLPKCRHLFHLNCIDRWLLLHPICPVCRSPPLQAHFVISDFHW